MAIELAEAYISILPSTSKLAPAIRQELGKVEKSSQETGKRAGGLLAGGFRKALLVGGASAGGLGLALKKLTGGASDLNESINAVTVTYGKQAKGVLKLSEDAARGLGLSSTEFNALSVRFSAFAKQVSGGGKATVSTLDAMTTRAADFASVMNLEVNEAAQIFQSGLAGESEPLRRFGYDLSAAAVNAYAYKKGIAEAGKTLTEQQKVQARYALLMKATAKAQDDFTNTADDPANLMRRLKSTVADLSAEIGTGLLPVIKDVGGFLLDTAIPAVESFVEQWKSGEGTAGRLRDALAALGASIKATVEWAIRWRDVLIPTAAVVLSVVAGVRAYHLATAAWASATAAATAVKAAWLAVMHSSQLAWAKSVGYTIAYRGTMLALTAVEKAHAAVMIAAGWAKHGARIAFATAKMVAHRAVTLAMTAATKVAAAGQWLLNAAMSANPIGLVVALIAGLVAALVVAYKKSDTFRRIVDATWDAIKRAISVAWERVIKPVFNLWWEHVTRVGKVIQWLWEKAAKPALGALMDFLSDRVVPAFRTAADFISRFFKGLSGAATVAIRFVVGTLWNNGLRKVLNWIPGVNVGAVSLPVSSTRGFTSPSAPSGYAAGGYTGRGGKYDPAGIVHRDEYVLRSESRRAFERRHPGALDYLNNYGTLPGFARGGRVWPTADRTPTTYPGHDGLDFGMPSGSPIRAAANGVISYVGWGRGYGLATFQRGPYGELVYGHQSRTAVRAGQAVNAGQYIGAVGSTGNSTGPHLHFGFPGGTFAQALSFLQGAKVVGGSAGGGGFFDVIGKAREVWSAIKDMSSNGWMGTLKDAFRNVVGDLKDWINDKIPGPGPIPGGIFDSGGVLEPGHYAYNASRHPEAVFNHRQFRDLATAGGPARGCRYEMRITNWRDGTGYMREVADGAAADRAGFAATAGRMR